MFHGFQKIFREGNTDYCESLISNNIPSLTYRWLPSKMATFSMPCCFRWKAALIPETPAPMTITDLSFSSSMLLIFVGDTGRRGIEKLGVGAKTRAESSKVDLSMFLFLH